MMKVRASHKVSFVFSLLQDRVANFRTGRQVSALQTNSFMDFVQILEELKGSGTGRGNVMLNHFIP